MNWAQIEGRWKRLSGQAKSEWTKLTDDDLELIAGNRARLVGKLREHYGVVEDDAEKQIDLWIATLSAGNQAKH